MGVGDELSDLVETIWETVVQQYPSSQDHRADLIAAISRLDRARWIEDNLDAGQVHPGLGAFRAMAKRRWASRSCGKDYTMTYGREDPVSPEEAMAGTLNDNESDSEGE